MHAIAVSPPTPSQAEPLILVEEISHRVYNEYAQVIAGIRLAAKGIASSEARAALTSAATRLLRYAEAHRALQAPACTGTADIANHRQGLCAALTAASLDERGVRLTLVTDKITLSADRCWRVALIVSELITNSVRHGLQNGPGNIRVSVSIRDRVVDCRVSDDGRRARGSKPGRGTAVVTGLARELDGTVAWRLGSEGTTAQLKFPLSIREDAA